MRFELYAEIVPQYVYLRIALSSVDTVHICKRTEYFVTVGVLY